MPAQITQAIALLPASPDPTTDTPDQFSIKAAASVLAQRGLPPEINTWGAQANLLSIELNTKAGTADSAAANAMNYRDLAEGYKNNANSARDAAIAARDQSVAAAAMAGTTVAFSDSLPVVKGSADATKLGGFEVDTNVPTGTRVNITWPGAAGTMARLSDIDHRSDTYLNSETAPALNFLNAGYVRFAPTPGQSYTITLTNFTTAAETLMYSFRPVIIEGHRLGGATLTWPSVNWILPNGATTTNIAAAGFTFSTTGPDFVILWRRAGGAEIYGKVIR